MEGISSGAGILELLEDDEQEDVEEEVVDGVMRSLERDIIGAGRGGAVLPSAAAEGINGHYLPSDSAYTLSSSSSRVSDGNLIGCRCGCEEIRPHDQLGFLMEASDEELGLSPPPSTVCSDEFEGHVDLGVGDENWAASGAAECSFQGWREMIDLDMCGVVAEDVAHDLVGVERVVFP